MTNRLTYAGMNANTNGIVDIVFGNTEPQISSVHCICLE